MASAASTAVDAWTLVDELPGSVAVIDSAGIIHSVNPLWRVVFAHTEGAAEVGADFFERLLPTLGTGEDIAGLGRAVRAALNGRRGQAVDISLSSARGPTWFTVR